MVHAAAEAGVDAIKLQLAARHHDAGYRSCEVLWCLKVDSLWRGSNL